MNKSKFKTRQSDSSLMQEKKISRLYHRLAPSGPGSRTDKKILLASRNAVSGDSPTGHRPRWLIPIAIAASIALLVMGVLMFNPATDKSPMIANDTQSERQYEGNLKPDPTRSLDTIANLVQLGQIEEAKKQLEAFRLLYKDYKIDYKRYPELRQLDEPEP